MKGIFPFRLGTTSYILPASVIPNIRFLGPFLDEIEIILFESKGEGSLPARAEIDEMRLLAEEFDLVYNVHLPTDVFLGDADPQLRERARQTILRFIDRTSRLDPTVFILHSEEGSNADVRKNTDRNAWMSRMVESLEKLVREGADPRQLALENIVYTPETIFPLAEHLGMSLCLDIGHLLRCGHSVQDQIRQLSGKVSMVHLHGVREGRDHSGIQFIPQDEWNSIYQALRGDFTGGVSLEVFSLEDLIPSLQRIRECL
jgi:sugar phosphate isomerase/epimerase